LNYNFEHNLIQNIALTDNDYKYSNAFSFLKECSKEVSAVIPRL